MLDYSFRIYGHKNILSAHSRTMEFTKDSELTKNGDCIVGVKAEFLLHRLKPFLSSEKVRIKVAVDGMEDSVTAIPNAKFRSSREMVIRIGEFDSERTFAVRADKASSGLSRALVAALKSGRAGTVTVSETR